jgi:fibronectin-binding autotransporter adhesin
MKSFCLRIAVCVAALSVSGHAASLTWDADPGTAGAQDGGGTWDAAATTWWDGSANTNWNSAAPDSAIFGAGGTPGAVSLGAALAVSNLTFNADYAIRSNTLTLSGASTAEANTAATIESVLTGSGAALVKTGPGTLTLTGSNTYSGGTAIDNGALRLGNGTANGTAFGAYAIATGASLYLDFATAVSRPWTNLSGSGTFELNSAQPVNGSANWGLNTPGATPFDPAFTGTLVMDKGRIDASPAGLGGVTNIVIKDGAQFLGWTGTYSVPVAIAGRNGWGEPGYPLPLRTAGGSTNTWMGAVTLLADAGILAQGNSTFTIGGTIAGNYENEFNAQSGATLVVAPAAAVRNAYGSTLVSGAGSIVAGNPYALSAGGLRMNGGTLKLNGASFDVARLSGGAGTVGNYHAADASSLTVGADGASTAYGGTLTDGGAATLGLVKTGVGTLTLNSANSHGGGTTISGGRLISGRPASLGAGPVMLENAVLGVAAAALAGFGGSGAGWQLNTVTGALPSVGNDVLTITDNGGSEARSAFYAAKFPIANSFTAGFTYTVGGNKAADGMAFVVQNNAATAVGLGGGGLGYQGMANSAALEFNLYTGAGPVGIAYHVNGVIGQYTSTAPVNLASGNPILVRIVYDSAAQTLTAVLTELGPGNARTFVYTGVNLAATVGGTTAYIGFTGGTGGAVATQTIGDYLFNPLVAAVHSNAVVVADGANGGIESLVPAAALGAISMGANAALTVTPGEALGSDIAYGLSFGDVTLAGGATFDIFDNGAAGGSLLLGPASGAGPVTKAGAGSLSLTGVSTYSGDTTVGEGMLVVNGALGAGAVDVAAANAGLSGEASIGGPVTSAGLVSPGTNALGAIAIGGDYTQTATGILSLNLGGPVSFGSLSVGGIVTLGGELRVAFANGFVPVATQSFPIVSAGSVNGAFATTNLPPLTTPGLVWDVHYASNAVILAIAGEPPAMAAIPFAKDFGGIATGQTSIAAFTVTNVSSSVAFTGMASVVAGSPPFSISGAAGFSLGPHAWTNVSVMFSPTSAGTFTGAVVFASNLGGSVTNAVAGQGIAQELIWDPLLLTSGGSDGSGTWDLSTSNWWNGALTSWIDGRDAIFGAGGAAGTVSLGASIAVGNMEFGAVGSGSYLIQSNTLTLSSPSTITANTNAAIASGVVGGGLIKRGDGALTLSGGGIVYTGATAVASGKVIFSNVTGWSAVTPGSMGVLSNDAAVAFYASGNNAFIVPGRLSGSGVYEVDGPGGGSSYQNRIILRGNLADNVGVITVINSGKLWLDRNVNAIGDSAVVDVGPAAGFYTYAADGSDVWGAFLPAETIGGLSGSGHVYGVWASGATSPMLAVGGGDTTASFDGAIGEDAGTPAGFRLVKIGAGTQSLNGASTYAGGTTLSNGALAVGNDAALGSGALTMAGGTLRAAGGARTVGNAVSVTSLSFVDTSAGDLTLTGSITNAAVLVKQGAGELILPGSQPESGSLVVSNGALVVNGSTGAGLVTVASGGELKGVGTIGGPVVCSGTLSPGASPGQLTVAGAIVLNSGARLRVELGGLTQVSEYDLLKADGIVALGGDLDLVFIDGFEASVAPGDLFFVVQAGSLSGEFANAPIGGTIAVGGQTFAVHYGPDSTYGSTNVVLEAVAASADSDGDGLTDDQETALGTNAFDPDSDDDGMNDGDEVVAGSNPRDADSIGYRIIQEQKLGGAVVVRWSSTSNRTYDVLSATNLNGAQNWTPVSSVPSGGATTGYTNASPVSQGFYQIRGRATP